MGAEGRDRSLVIEDQDHEMTISLCEECYQEVIEEEWIESCE